MTDPADDWRPTADRAVLEHRATLLARTRAFFARRHVLEVETPMLVRHAVTDVHLRAARVELGLGSGAPGYYLQTSPEYAMKRLLAAGIGDIYQICKVARGGERGRLHNPEFTLVEWYRLGISLEQLMDEVATLVRDLLGAAGPARGPERIAYRDAFLRELGLDPLEAGLEELASAARALGYDRGTAADRDELLDLLMAARVGPQLGRGRLTFVHRYPASQAQLAELDPGDARVAQRFELYADGIELANGFRELASAPEQRARFEADRRRRRALGLPDPDTDERLLAALAAGLPDCCGVALGFDRTVMIATGASRIDEVLAFPAERA